MGLKREERDSGVMEYVPLAQQVEQGPNHTLVMGSVSREYPY